MTWTTIRRSIRKPSDNDDNDPTEENSRLEWRVQGGRKYTGDIYSIERIPNVRMMDCFWNCEYTVGIDKSVDE